MEKTYVVAWGLAGVYDASGSKRFFLGIIRYSLKPGDTFSDYVVAVSKTSDPTEGLSFPSSHSSALPLPYLLTSPKSYPPMIYSRRQRDGRSQDLPHYKAGVLIT
jgi:hypothetical protein